MYLAKINYDTPIEFYRYISEYNPVTSQEEEVLEYLDSQNVNFYHIPHVVIKTDYGEIITKHIGVTLGGLYTKHFDLLRYRDEYYKVTSMSVSKLKTTYEAELVQSLEVSDE